MEELRVIYGKQKSYYGKALVERAVNENRLYSYGSLVAKYIISDSKLELYADWDYSNTTLKHVKEFAAQNNVIYKATKKQLKEYEVI